MGKGDRKSRKGKIFRGSHGVVRPKKSAVKVIIPVKKKVEPKKEVAEKPVAVKKKAVVKKKAAPKKTAVKKK
tara:strand:+ start:208 stop:423 length:216 start_codon:yes stop_codon:yes gene_type:complete